MTPVVLFSIFAVAWALYAIPAARRRFRLDGQALTLGLIAAVGTIATIVAVGLLVGSTLNFWWVLLPVVVVLMATVLAERRRSVVLRSRPAAGQPAHDG